MSDEKIHYKNGDGTVVVSDTLLTFNGGHYPIRNISSVKLATLFPMSWMPAMKKLGIALIIFGLLIAAISEDPFLIIIGFFIFLCWFLNPVWIEISSGGSKELINKASARTSYEGTVEVFDAINISIRDIQNS